MSSPVPRIPSGPGWFLPRVSTMNAWSAGTSSPVFALPSGPSFLSGSSALSGTKTVPPPLTVWSTPWSKNWPNSVNSELYGGERPTSVVTLGMNSVLWDGVHSGGTAAMGGSTVSSGSVVHGTTPGLPWVRTGKPAARIAAGWVEVWSTMRLLTTRGSVSKTLPVFCLYDEEAGGPNKGGLLSAALKSGVANRGNTWSAAPTNSCPCTRLLHEP